MNTPYVKQYENGVLTNPINGEYKSEFPNRRARRMKPKREMNNRGKDTVVTVQISPTAVIAYRVVKNNLGRTYSYPKGK